MNALKFTVHVKKRDDYGTINPSQVGSAYGHYDGVRWTYAADAGTYGVFHLVVDADQVEFIESELNNDNRVTYFNAV